MPILNSYTKIAPHPGKGPFPQRRRARKDGGMQKKVCTERAGAWPVCSQATKTGAGPPQPRPPCPLAPSLRDPALRSVPSLVAGGSPQTLQQYPAAHVAKAPSLTFASLPAPSARPAVPCTGWRAASRYPACGSYNSTLWAASTSAAADGFPEQRQSNTALSEYPGQSCTNPVCWRSL